MGAKDLQKKLKKKKNKDGDSQPMNSNFVQNDESFPKVTKESKRKKKKVNMQNRRNKDKVDECHLSSHKGDLNEADDIVEKDRPFPIAKDNFPVEREQAEEKEIYELSSGNEDYSKGMRKWIADYYLSRLGLEVLQERIDEFIIDYEAKKEQEKKEKEALAAEDGWTVVVHHKGRKKIADSETGIAVGSVSQAAVMDNMAKKKNKDMGLDFYQFQKREAKRNEIMVLQSKFEQDKKRIQQLRAARKFRPY
ncbi:unnamed protein product [Withania somnifera]